MMSLPEDAVDVAPFGTLAGGGEVPQVVLRAPGGAWVRLIGWGAAVQALHVPDRGGTLADVVLGHDTLAEYVEQQTYLGATIGRYGNRLGEGRFSLDGRQHHVPAIDHGQALHGGREGFDRRPWRIAALSGPGEPASVRFARTSPDGEEGFPGTLSVEAGYRLDEAAGVVSLTLDYRAETDAPTVINLTNHSYFNLAGQGRSALSHLVTIEADAFAEVTPLMIPTGRLVPLDGSPLDFRSPHPVGARIRQAGCRQLALGRGYDHSYALRGGRTGAPKPAVRAVDPGSGRVLEIATTEPALQFYSGNFLTGHLAGKGGLLIRQGDALCFETQSHPDSPNRPEFPSTRLDPGRIFRSRTVWRFSTERNRA